MESILLIVDPGRDKDSTDTEVETCFGKGDTDTLQVESFDTDKIPIRYFELKVWTDT